MEFQISDFKYPGHSPHPLNLQPLFPPLPSLSLGTGSDGDGARGENCFIILSYPGP